MSLQTILRKPSGFLPFVMSFSALTLVLAHLAIFGIAREADEGIAAHLWQLLMAGQVPILAFFAIRWLPKAPRSALLTLTLQVVAALAATAPVYLLHL